MEKGSLKRHFFIAVNLPSGAKKQIERDVRAKSEDKAYAEWRWKPAAEYHISLAFPGALDEAEVKRLRTALATLDHESFDIDLKGVRFFLRHNDPKRKEDNQHVLWLGLSREAENNLRVLHHKVIDLLKRNGFHYGRNDITPHVSIAKVPMDDISAMRDFSDAHGEFTSKSWHCDKVSLYETLTPENPRYAEKKEKTGSRYVEVEHYRLRNVV